MGSGYNDWLTGNGEDNDLQGGAGNDLLEGGAGEDTLDGGAGDDTLSYDGESAGVAVDLKDGSQTAKNYVSGNERGKRDTISNFENVIGSSGADKLTGNDDPNTLEGGDGNDEIAGGGGNDILEGGDGNDEIAGGGGSDILEGGEGTDTLGGGAGADTLRGGTEGDTLRGGDDGDFLYGDAGNDFLYGEAGNDELTGGDGTDTLEGGDGTDTLTGGAGADTYVYHYVDTTNGRKDGIDTITAEAGAGNTIRIVVDSRVDTWGEGEGIYFGNHGSEDTKVRLFFDTSNYIVLDRADLDDNGFSSGGVSKFKLEIQDTGGDPATGFPTTATALRAAYDFFVNPPPDQDYTYDKSSGGESFTELGNVNINIAALGIGFDSAHDKTQQLQALLSSGKFSYEVSVSQIILTFGDGSTDFPKQTLTLNSSPPDITFVGSKLTYAAGDSFITDLNLYTVNTPDAVTDADNTYLVQGSGTDDTADFSGLTDSVVLNLATGEGTLGTHAVAVNNIEHIKGGTGNDELTSDAQGNTLEGGGGEDTLTGGGRRRRAIRRHRRRHLARRRGGATRSKAATVTTGSRVARGATRWRAGWARTPISITTSIQPMAERTAATRSQKRIQETPSASSLQTPQAKNGQTL